MNEIMNELINYEGVFRTAPATPDMEFFKKFTQARFFKDKLLPNSA